jgi:hypothetical protein
VRGRVDRHGGSSLSCHRGAWMGDRGEGGETTHARLDSRI